MGPQQESIYFILANNREMALNSPYYEPFKKSEVPVLIINMHVDEMVEITYFRFSDNCRTIKESSNL
jgi:HSP90 family molecular chaperone